MYSVLFPNRSSIISEKCMVTPNFLFGYQNHLLTVLLSPHSFKPRKNIPVLVSTTHRKFKYLGMRSNKVGTVLNFAILDNCGEFIGIHTLIHVLNGKGF